MTTHSSAPALEETPHETETTLTTISDATKRRAELVIKDQTIDREWRTIIRGALDFNDLSLAELVNRAEAGDNIADTFESLRLAVAEENESSVKVTEEAAEIICRDSNEATAALFLLMGVLENSPDRKELANTAKRFAFNSLRRVKSDRTVEPP